MQRLRQCRRFSIESVSKRAIAVAGLGSGAQPVTFRNFFLRDGSPSVGAVDPETRQKTFNTGSLAPDVFPKTAVVENDALVVDWSDGHRATYPREWLERYSSAPATAAYRRVQEWVPLAGRSAVHKVQYDDYMRGSGSEYVAALEALNQYGLLQIVGVPAGEGSPPTVESLAAAIGEFARPTFYGTSWNVKSVPQPRNVAYTSVYLPLHMDLLYYESPPGLQYLHVIENTTVGGDSIFSDSYAAALDVFANDPEAYAAMCEVPLTYHYENDGRHYFQMRPMIVESKYGQVDPRTNRPFIDHLNYSPPFQGPLDAVARDVTDAQLDAFLRGLKRFEAFIEAEKNQIEFRMDPGTCIVFHNRRVLHARREFDASSGSRWFKGTYVDIDAFYSALRTAR